MKPEFKIHKQKSGNSQLIIKGDLISQHSKDFRDQLRKCLDQGCGFDISLKEVSTMDITALQLLQSFRNELESAKKNLFVAPPQNQQTMQLLSKCGFRQIVQATLTAEPELTER